MDGLLSMRSFTPPIDEASCRGVDANRIGEDDEKIVVVAG